MLCCRPLLFPLTPRAFQEAFSDEDVKERSPPGRVQHLSSPGPRPGQRETDPQATPDRPTCGLLTPPSRLSHPRAPRLPTPALQIPRVLTNLSSSLDSAPRACLRPTCGTPKSLCSSWSPPPTHWLQSLTELTALPPPSLVHLGPPLASPEKHTFLRKRQSGIN